MTEKWAAIIQHTSECTKLMEIHQEMMEQQVEMTFELYMHLIRAAAKSRRVSNPAQVANFVTELWQFAANRFEASLWVCTELVKAFAVVCTNSTLIDELIVAMKSGEVAMDPWFYADLVKAYAKFGNKAKVDSLFKELGDSCLVDGEWRLRDAFISAYVKLGAKQDALRYYNTWKPVYKTDFQAVLALLDIFDSTNDVEELSRLWWEVLQDMNPINKNIYARLCHLFIKHEQYHLLSHAWVVLCNTNTEADEYLLNVSLIGFGKLKKYNRISEIMDCYASLHTPTSTFGRCLIVYVYGVMFQPPGTYLDMLEDQLQELATRKIKENDYVYYNVLLALYQDDLSKAEGVIEEGRKTNGLKPNAAIYCQLLQVFAKHQLPQKVTQVKSAIIHKELPLSSANWCQVLHSYYILQNLATVESVMKGIVEKQTVTIPICCMMGRISYFNDGKPPDMFQASKVSELAGKLLLGSNVKPHDYNQWVLTKLLLYGGELRQTRGLGRLIPCGTTVFVAELLRYYGNHLLVAEVQKTKASLQSLKVNPTLQLVNSLLYVYGKANLLDQIQPHFDLIKENGYIADVETYCVLMYVYGLQRQYTKVQQVYVDAKKYLLTTPGYEPGMKRGTQYLTLSARDDHIFERLTLTCVWCTADNCLLIRLKSDMDNFLKKKIRARSGDMNGNGNGTDVSHPLYTHSMGLHGFLHAYSNNGNYENCKRVFDTLRTNNLVTYVAFYELMKCLYINCNYPKIRHMSAEMTKQGIVKTPAIYHVLVLTALNEDGYSARFVEEDIRKSDYFTTHPTVMYSLLLKLHQFNTDAIDTMQKELIRNQVDPNLVILAALCLSRKRDEIVPFILHVNEYLARPKDKLNVWPLGDDFQRYYNQCKQAKGIPDYTQKYSQKWETPSRTFNNTALHVLGMYGHFEEMHKLYTEMKQCQQANFTTHSIMLYNTVMSRDNALVSAPSAAVVDTIDNNFQQNVTTCWNNILKTGARPNHLCWLMRLRAAKRYPDKVEHIVCEQQEELNGREGSSNNQHQELAPDMQAEYFWSLCHKAKETKNLDHIHTALDYFNQTTDQHFDAYITALAQSHNKKYEHNNTNSNSADKYLVVSNSKPATSPSHTHNGHWNSPETHSTSNSSNRNSNYSNSIHHGTQTSKHHYHVLYNVLLYFLSADNLDVIESLTRAMHQQYTAAFQPNSSTIAVLMIAFFVHTPNYNNGNNDTVEKFLALIRYIKNNCASTTFYPRQLDVEQLTGVLYSNYGIKQGLEHCKHVFEDWYETFNDNPRFRQILDTLDPHRISNRSHTPKLKMSEYSAQVCKDLTNMTAGCCLGEDFEETECTIMSSFEMFASGSQLVNGLRHNNGTPVFDAHVTVPIPLLLPEKINSDYGA